MKILVSLTDPRFGGPQRSSLQIADYLSDHGVETQFLLPDGDSTFAKIARSHGFKTHQIGLKSLKPPKEVISNALFGAHFPLDVWNVRRVIQREDIDLVNARMAINYHAVLGAITTKTPLVWHFNDVSTPEFLAAISAPIARRYADEIIVRADNVTEYFGFASTDHVTKIHPSVSIDEFTLDSAEGASLLNRDNPEYEIVIGLAGNINSLKGYDTFLTAFAEIAADRPDAIVTIAGKKLATQRDYYDQLTSQIRASGLEERVHFLGWVEDMKGYLEAIDLFVMPSHSETGPMTLLEAMAMKKPIVTTNVGVVPEAVSNDEAWIVEPANPIQLGEAMTVALQNREQWKRLGNAARKRAVTTFSSEKAAKDHLEVYRSVLR